MQIRARWRAGRDACKPESRLDLDRLVLFIEKRHAVTREKPVYGTLVFRDEAIELAFPFLVGLPPAHANTVSHARAALLLDKRHYVEIGFGTLDEVTADRAPKNRDIDFAGLEIPEHFVGRGIETRIDHERIGTDR